MRYLIIILAFVACKKEPQVTGNWYEFKSYYNGVETGKFSLHVDINRPSIIMYQDTEHKKVAYSGVFINDTFINLEDKLTHNGEMTGVYKDTTILLYQLGYSYKGRKI